MPQQRPSLTIPQQIGRFAELASYPALTVQLFGRKKMGFRKLSPSKVVLMTGVMFLYATVWENLPSSADVPIFRSRVSSVAAPEKPLPLVGWDEPQPANWDSMTFQQQQAWVQRHQVRDRAIMAQQQEARDREIARRQQQAQEEAESAARWARLRAKLAYWPMALYALAFCIWGLIQRRSRWYMLLRGEIWHTRSFGLSHVETTLSNFMSQANILRIIDPLLTFLVGIFALFVSRPLGWWIIFSSLCFHFVEQYVYELRLEKTMDDHDALADANATRQNAEHFTKGSGSGGGVKAMAEAARTPMAKTSGVIPPAAFEPEIEAQNAKNREERRAYMRERAAAQKAAEDNSEQNPT